VAKAMRVKDSIFSGFLEVVPEAADFITRRRRRLVCGYFACPWGRNRRDLVLFDGKKILSRCVSNLERGPCGPYAAEVGKGACVVVT